MSDYFEIELVADAIIDMLAHELAVSFMPEESKIIRDYLHQYPNANINEILEVVFNLKKNKEAFLLNKDKLENLKRHFNNIKNLLIDAKFFPWIELNKIRKRDHSNTKPSDDDYLIIKEAEKKLLDNNIIKKDLSPLEIRLALNYFRFYEAESVTPADRANIALLGVINVRIAGGIKPVVLHSWGNLLNVPDVNAMAEHPDGGAMIDRGNRSSVLNIIKIGNLNKFFLEKLPNLDVDPKQQNQDQKEKTQNAQDSI